MLTAAFTDVDGSERDPDAAFAVNSAGTENVANGWQKFGGKLLYISTDYVFDGSGTRPYEPEDPIAPINVYGESKARGEKAVQDNLKDWCIVRTSWLFGASGFKFPGEDSARGRNQAGIVGRGRPGGLTNVHARPGRRDSRTGSCRRTRHCKRDE